MSVYRVSERCIMCIMFNVGPRPRLHKLAENCSPGTRVFADRKVMTLLDLSISVTRLMISLIICGARLLSDVIRSEIPTLGGTADHRQADSSPSMGLVAWLTFTGG